MLTTLHLHTGQPAAPHDVWQAWEVEPLVLAGALTAAWLYATGHRRSAADSVQGRAFAAGLGAVVAALASPLDVVAGSLASAHMVQHMLLTVVAGPLLASSRPVATILHGLPPGWRKGTGRWRRRVGLTPRRMLVLGGPGFAWLANAGSLWLWHSSVLYEAAIRSDAVHALEHASFLIAAVWLWSAALRGLWSRRSSPGVGILLLFTTAIQGVLLSAIITFAGSPWYETYESSAPSWGMTALQDQHLAGLIMWTPSTLIYTGIALALLMRWISDTERSEPRAATGRRA